MIEKTTTTKNIDKEKLIAEIKEKYYINYTTPMQHVRFKVAREIIELIENLSNNK